MLDVKINLAGETQSVKGISVMETLLHESGCRMCGMMAGW